MFNIKKNTNPYELLSLLGTREREVFDAIVQDITVKEIAVKLKIKPNTVSTIKKIVFRKLKVNSNIELYKFAQKCNIV